MNKLIQIVLLLGIFGSFLAADSSIKAMKVLGNVSDIGPTSKAWLSSGYQDVTLYPQTTIKINDKDTNELNVKAKKVRVKAITDGKNISFLIKWKDETKSIQDNYNTHGDGFVMQFPVDATDVTKLPYVGMGNKGRAVIVHFKKAIGLIYEIDGEVYTQVGENNQNIFADDLQKYIDEAVKKGEGDYQKVFISEGFHFMTQIKDGSTVGKMHMVYKNGYWKGTLSCPLKSDYLDLTHGAFPVSFALWDGVKKNRDGLKLLSSWIGVKVVGKSGGGKLINSLEVKPKGDEVNGEKIAFENCAACHKYGEVNIAPDFMAPNLSNIGGYSTKEYLMESIVNPNAVVVPDYNTNAHKNFFWYDIDDKGVRTSTMPSYNWLDKKSRDDLVAFLKSLKVQTE